MTRTAAIIFGHSHLSSIVTGLLNRPGESYAPEPGIEYYVFDTMRHGANFQFSTPDAEGNYVLNPILREEVAKEVPPQYNHVYLSMFGGNAHNALTLLEHPVPFDFILPEEPFRPRLPGKELLPYGYIEKFIRKLAEPYILNMITLKNAVSSPVVHIESPPPIGDNQFVLDHLEQYFKDQSVAPNVAPRELRYKLWRLHSRIIREAATPNGIEFLPAPPEGMDAEGYLLKTAYGNDSTHAGEQYGILIAKQIEHRFGAPYGGWRWL